MTITETAKKAENLKEDFLRIAEFTPISLLFEWLVIELESPTITLEKITEWLQEI